MPSSMRAHDGVFLTFVLFEIRVILDCQATTFGEFLRTFTYY